MRRTIALLSTAALSAGVLAGCGSDGGSSADDYCKDLETVKADVQALDDDNPDFNAFGDALESFGKFADNAPSEVRDDWKVMDEAFSKLEKSLEDAGLSFEDLGIITTGEMPEGMTPEKLAEIGPKLEKAFEDFDEDKLEKASDAIEKHAKDECGIDLDEDSEDSESK